MKYRLTSLAVIGILILLTSGCSKSIDAPRIKDIVLDPPGPVAPNTDVRVTADVEGGNLTYHWSVSGGYARKLEAHQAQKAELPKVAVTKAGYDDVGEVLDDFDFPYYNLSLNSMGNSGVLSQFDAIFINSSLEISVAGSELALKSWVEDGGALYLSGTAYDYLPKLWPDIVTFPEPEPYVGSANTYGEVISAQILDKATAAALGITTLNVEYPDYPWPPVIDTKYPARVIATADASDVVDISAITNLPPGEDFSSMPISIFFPYGDGMVLFTNKHYQDGLAAFDLGLVQYMVASVAIFPIAKTSHTLIDMGGYFPATDYVGFISEGVERKYAFDLAGAGDVYIVLNAPDGEFDFKVDGPEDSDADVTGTAPISMAFPGVTDGKWTIKIKANDTGDFDHLPYALSIGKRTSSEELVTDVPEVIWRVPFEPDIYTIRLNIIDDYFREDEFTVGVQVK